MPRPTPKKPKNKVKTKKRTSRNKKRVRARPPRKSYVPKRIQADLKTLGLEDRDRFELPMHTQIGHTE